MTRADIQKALARLLAAALVADIRREDERPADDGKAAVARAAAVAKAAAAAKVVQPQRSNPPAVPSLSVTLGGGTMGIFVWLGVAILATTCLLGGAALQRRRGTLPPL